MKDAPSSIHPSDFDNAERTFNDLLSKKRDLEKDLVSLERAYSAFIAIFSHGETSSQTSLKKDLLFVYFSSSLDDFARGIKRIAAKEKQRIDATAKAILDGRLSFGIADVEQMWGAGVAQQVREAIELVFGEELTSSPFFPEYLEIPDLDLSKIANSTSCSDERALATNIIRVRGIVRSEFVDPEYTNSLLPRGEA